MVLSSSADGAAAAATATWTGNSCAKDRGNHRGFMWPEFLTQGHHALPHSLPRSQGSQAMSSSPPLQHGLCLEGTCPTWKTQQSLPCGPVLQPWASLPAPVAMFPTSRSAILIRICQCEPHCSTWPQPLSTLHWQTLHPSFGWGWGRRLKRGASVLRDA